MSDKNLKDKMKNIGNSSKDYEDKIKKEKKKKIITISSIVIVVCLVLGLFLYKSRITNNKGSENPKIESSENNNKENKGEKETDDNFVVQDNNNEAEVQLANNKGKPESLNENFKDKIKDEKAIGSDEEYKAIDKKTTAERNKFYESNVALNTIAEGVEPSEKDGYTDDINKKMDGELIADNYVPITAERLETVISHELEKIVNPKYAGTDIEDSDNGVITSVYIEKRAQSGDNEMFVPEYHVFYTISYPLDGSYAKEPEDGEIVFTVNERGEIEWITRS